MKILKRDNDEFEWLNQKAIQYKDDSELHEYIQGMANKEQSALKSQLRRLLLHLIKYQK